ncbi:TauD/TfdA family dioxygenase [Allokutzneria sp. A3M-2-11 16]|uniref:TauD/TfdA dioxygenase family protein n=1 Tax=Allokutzneria sp. A3M-2-11 16 TaxID=2962043 RepID=UPI0020B73CE5|nr:TauD/TfdA family dioxygenase [Allokutzneria sp. A3M-2-11 16]MCP3798439.1 TauD/TfdA family dioxygenase [Allokutzneria sp. A3M-2-11 16]
MGAFTTTRNEPFGVTIAPAEPGADFSVVPAATLVELAREHHIVLLRGFTGIEGAPALTEFSATLGELVEWPFGYVLELVESDNPSDHIFDHSYVPMHWDGMYMPKVPEFQVFHCVLAPGAADGGETTFADTTLVLGNATPRELERWAKVTGTYRRKMEFYDSLTIAPLIAEHPHTGTPVIRYNELTSPEDDTFINHPDLEFTGLPESELAEVHAEVTKALYDAANFYAHTWQDGDLVITDNFTLLHGRNAFTAKAPRHLRRVHVGGIANPHLVTT